MDGRNPTPVDRWFIPLFIGFQPSKVVQDFFHQQLETINQLFSSSSSSSSSDSSSSRSSGMPSSADTRPLGSHRLRHIPDDNFRKMSSPERQQKAKHTTVFNGLNSSTMTPFYWAPGPAQSSRWGEFRWCPCCESYTWMGRSPCQCCWAVLTWTRKNEKMETSPSLPLRFFSENPAGNYVSCSMESNVFCRCSHHPLNWRSAKNQVPTYSINILV